MLVSIGFRPPDVCGHLGLAVDDGGHLVVDHEAAVRKATTAYFAAGDSATFADRKLPKVGVVAVYQGRVLRHNLVAAALGGRLRTYRPMPAPPADPQPRQRQGLGGRRPALVAR